MSVYHDRYTGTYFDLYGEPMGRTGIWPYVWKDPPTAGALDTYTGALVRAANGNGTTAPEGFNFASNYRAWLAKYGEARVQPWTYLYPTSNGTTAADALLGVAGRRDIYQCDLEDAVPPSVIRAFCDRLHSIVPGCKVVFDSYPTRRQFINVNGAAGAATWDQAVKSFDVFCPQVYYSSQKDDGWEDEFGPKPVWPAFSPANWAAWDYFQANLDRFGVANLWRYPFTTQWQGKLDYQQAQEDDMPGPSQWTSADWDAFDAHSGDRLIHYLDHGKDTDGSSDHHHAIRADITALRNLVQGEEDATQAAIANLQTAAVDPAALAAALGPLIGQDLAGKVASELATRLAQ